MQTENATEFRNYASANRAAKEAQAAACGCCLIGLAILTAGWLAVAGLTSAIRRHRTGGDACPAYPDPVCETCGLVLDGSRPVCSPETLNPSPLSPFGNGPCSSCTASARPIPGMAAAADVGARDRESASAASTGAR